MSNINFESGFLSTNLENKYEQILGYNDQSYTAAVDNGSYNNFANDSAGYGLCQWTYYTRKAALLNSAKSNGVSIGDVGNQISFLFRELKNGYRSKTRFSIEKIIHYKKDNQEYIKYENTFVDLIKRRNGLAYWETIKIS